ncbi:MAG: STAS domain-containing protein [SAR324 cluster bacterium]|nr:STAS domain-containing protein [SAR324 cluster bacterium]
MLESKIKKNIYIGTIISPFTLDDVHEVIDQVEQSKMSVVLLDMHDLGLITSTTLSIIVSLCKNLEEIQIKLGLFNLSDNNSKLLKIAGIDHLLFVFKNCSEGIAALGR